MMNKKYKREYKESQPVLAICYDFDRTLSPDDMQAQGYIQSVGYDVGSFWKESNGLAEANEYGSEFGIYVSNERNSCRKSFIYQREA